MNCVNDCQKITFDGGLFAEVKRCFTVLHGLMTWILYIFIFFLWGSWKPIFASEQLTVESNCGVEYKNFQVKYTRNFRTFTSNIFTDSWFACPWTWKLFRILTVKNVEMKKLLSCGGVDRGPLLLRPLIGLLYQSQRMMDVDEWVAIGGMLSRGNPSTRYKPSPPPPVSLCLPQSPHDLTGAWALPAAVVSRRQPTPPSQTTTRPENEEVTINSDFVCFRLIHSPLNLESM
jgi:hypothetical protein